MKSTPLFFFAVFLLALLIFFKIDHVLREGALVVGDEVKSGFFDAKDWLSRFYQRHFDQAQSLKKLFAQEQEIQALKIENTQLQAQLSQLLDFYQIPKPSLAGIHPVRALSYIEFGNYFRIWLEGYKGKERDFFGLVWQGYVVGIAKIDEEDRLVGYLNGDPLCSYSVYVGEQKISGIIKNQDYELIVDFIPLGSPIKVGDEVFSSGLDEIFSPNIPVGKIAEIRQENGYLSAKVNPYAKDFKFGYLWLLDRSKND